MLVRNSAQRHWMRGSDTYFHNVHFRTWSEDEAGPTIWKSTGSSCATVTTTTEQAGSIEYDCGVELPTGGLG